VPAVALPGGANVVARDARLGTGRRIPCMTSAMKADLHVHSNASDGKLSPAAVVDYAAEKGVTVMALTDHDSVGGVAEAAGAAESRGVVLIDGVELTSSAFGQEAHLLGYFVAPAHPELQGGLEQLRRRRASRGRDTVALLQQLGYPLPWEQVQAIAGGGSVGRPHVARALVTAGYAQDIADAFARFLSEGAPAYIPAPSLDVLESIAIVRAAGGIPVLAHPIALLEAVPALIEAGLEGIEVYYGAYSLAQREQLAAFATEHGLLQTGGSDFHGVDNREGRDLGSGDLPPEHVQQLIEARRGVAPQRAQRTQRRQEGRGT